MAPEIRLKGVSHNEKVDIWSSCILTYLMLIRQHPFKKDKKLSIEAVIKQEPYYA